MRTIHLKRFSFIAVAFVLSIFFLASCNKDGASVYVPKEAYTVANYNVKNIVEKCDIENIQKLSVFKTLRSELKRESYEADQTLDQILSDPA